MSWPLFLRILQGLQQHDSYFTQRVDATAYGLPSDAVDEYIQIGESTARECLQHFCRGIIAYFSGWYLRTPNEADITRIMHHSESRGFPGMLGSIDCMHWEWQNCPTAWRADGIYPNWPTFVKAIRHPYEQKKVYFTQMQESCRKDIERAFGVLQARWAVLRGPAYGWDRSRLTEIITACIIMHNMIVEDEGSFAANTDFGDNTSTSQAPQLIAEGRAEWLRYSGDEDDAGKEGIVLEPCNGVLVLDGGMQSGNGFTSGGPRGFLTKFK
ncbi:uncharacterized protein [Zea mays]|uniref:uncharacterized protein n=1 Tax=Zea mays TaxID=4577 RepID=UPI0016533F71|nr:uncharacterized protein LOC118473022 [Zea mays]